MEVEVEEAGDRLAVLTPATFPDGDGVVVYVAERGPAAFEVSDTIRMFVRLVSLELVAISVPSVSSQRAVSARVRVACP